jgi:NADP-dependent 3-hydroxy acid dehydrogenase YdfG
MKDLRYKRLLMIGAWKGKTVLVTGASSGIGSAVARRLLAEGMNVVACARRVELVESLGHAEALLPVRCDVRDESQILAMFEHARERFGGVDVLVNNAGLGHDAPLTSGSTEHWREMLEVNVLALCVCTREAVRDMRARGDSGHVIHISSMAAHRVPRGSGVYSATKFAVRSLTEGLRQELRAAHSKIRVSAISPGYVETEFAANYHRSKEAAKKTYGRFRVIQPEEVADAVVYVLGCPPHVQVHDVMMRPTEQES